jgi:hypothetical protein
VKLAEVNTTDIYTPGSTFSRGDPVRVVEVGRLWNSGRDWHTGEKVFTVAPGRARQSASGAGHLTVKGRSGDDVAALKALELPGIPADADEAVTIVEDLVARLAGTPLLVAVFDTKGLRRWEEVVAADKAREVARRAEHQERLEHEQAVRDRFASVADMLREHGGANDHDLKNMLTWLFPAGDNPTIRVPLRMLENLAVYLDNRDSTDRETGERD